MIQELALKNFDSYKKARIRFHPGVNVIIGSTDSGKTRIVEALIWVSRNKPAGDEFKSVWAKDKTTSVTIKKNGNMVRRSKGKRNLYVLKEKGKKKKEFVAFKTGVPEEIKKAIDLKKINFQEQHDPPFLLSMNSGERARYLNKIMNLDGIDRSQKNITSTIAKERQTLKQEKGNIKNHKRQIKEFNWLVHAEDDLRKIEILQRSIAKSSHLIEKAKDIISKLESIKKKIKKEKGKIQFEKEVNRLIEMRTALADEEAEVTKMFSLISSINSTKKHVLVARKKKRRLEKKFNRLMPDECPLCGRNCKCQKK